MNPQIGRAAFKIAFFVTFTSLCLLPFVGRDTPEFFVTTLTILIGLVFMGIIILVVRRLSH